MNRQPRLPVILPSNLPHSFPLSPSPYPSFHPLPFPMISGLILSTFMFLSLHLLHSFFSVSTKFLCLLTLYKAHPFISTGPSSPAPIGHWDFPRCLLAWLFETACENSDHLFRPSYGNQGSGSPLHGGIWGHQGLGAGSIAYCGQAVFQKGAEWAGFLKCHSSTKTCLLGGYLRVTPQPKNILHQPLEFKEFSPGEKKILILDSVIQAQLRVLQNGTSETICSRNGQPNSSQANSAAIVL